MNQALEFTKLSRNSHTDYSTIPADSDPCEELVETLEAFWNQGAVITDSRGNENTYAIWLHGSAPFEHDRVFRVRVIDIELPVTEAGRGEA